MAACVLMFVSLHAMHSHMSLCAYGDHAMLHMQCLLLRLQAIFVASAMHAELHTRGSRHAMAPSPESMTDSCYGRCSVQCDTWHVNAQDDKSKRSGRRSEADSEEAIQDVCALSQEGSLGSFSGSDRSFARRIEAAAESVPAQCHIRFLSWQLGLALRFSRNSISLASSSFSTAWTLVNQLQARYEVGINRSVLVPLKARAHVSWTHRQNGCLLPTCYRGQHSSL